MTVWEDIERVLNEERRLLLDGRIADLSRLAERKIALLSALRPADAEAPGHVRDMAEANAHLLTAAGRGIRSALQRIEDARGATTTRTYDVKGRLRPLTGQPSARGTRV